MTLYSSMKKLAAGAALMLAVPLLVHAGEIKARERWNAQDMDVNQADVFEELQFGREVAARIVGRYGYDEDQRLNRYVNLVGRSIAMSANRPELTFRFGILDTSDINAYAAPGGYIFVTRGAIEQMEDEAELAAVIAHEVGHVTGRHAVNELNIRASEGGSAGLARLAGGATEAARATMGQMVDKAVDMLFKDGYKREDEVQADGDAVVFAATAGYDPAALVRYFERLSALKGPSTEVLDKTHPGYSDRIAWLKDAIVADGIEPGELKSNKARFQDAIKDSKLGRK